MPDVAIVTDTTSYLPRDLLEANDITEVSLYVNWQGRQDREADIADYTAYYEYLRTAPDLPTTSQPSIGDFIDAYKPLLDAGRDVVSMHISAGISGTCESARQAKARLEEEGAGGERIEVIDAATSAGGMGLMLLASAAKSRSGADRETVAAHARTTREQLRIWFCVDTLEYLRRGGRIGAAQAWLGTALKIKPILTLEEEITPVERVRTAKRAFERMAEYLESLREQGWDAWVVQHIQAPDVAERLIDRGRTIFGTEPVIFSEVGPVLGTHTGPGLIGVGGAPKSLLG